MSKRRTTKYEHGDRYQVYINRTVDDELLSFINKQSDISGASMLGLILLYQMYGNTDIDDLLPRNYRVNANIPNLNINFPNSIPTNEVRVSDTGVVSSNNESDIVGNTGRDEAPTVETRPALQKEVEPTISEDIKNIETDNPDNKNDLVSPIQNEISNERKEETSNSKGNGLNAIRTSSMMQFGNMMKPKNGK
ncbi:hypothetical protein ACIQ1D_18070 [Lysinibacillus xylanilyticus]|uniref:Uncharacterized protein n=1 Tax=Lysinibacillus xylanilyticus TaxID=582475 RepID=A0A2M9QA21_9BACI|nr:hypothetical protein [Lysinibacillus xylanilyticus]PJO44909.1 hypothetical protein CWD94_04275 [Lysinibacillus xylanilyticus]